MRGRDGSGCGVGQLRHELGRCGGSGCLAQAGPTQEGERGRAKGPREGWAGALALGKRPRTEMKKGRRRKRILPFLFQIDFQKHFQIDF